MLKLNTKKHQFTFAGSLEYWIIGRAPGIYKEDIFQFKKRNVDSSRYRYTDNISSYDNRILSIYYVVLCTYLRIQRSGGVLNVCLCQLIYFLDKIFIQPRVNCVKIPFIEYYTTQIHIVYEIGIYFKFDSQVPTKVEFVYVCRYFKFYWKIWPGKYLVKFISWMYRSVVVCNMLSWIENLLCSMIVFHQEIFKFNVRNGYLPCDMSNICHMVNKTDNIE